MRWVLAIALLASCSFERNPGMGTGDDDDAGPTPSDGPPDMVDTPIIPATCPERYNINFNQHSYFGTSGMQRAAAVTICGEDGGHLIKIEDDAEALELAAQVDIVFGPREVWIGLADLGEGYAWHDGTGATFSRWNGTPPTSPGDADCVVADTNDGNGRWSAHNCTDDRIAVCECDAD